MKYEPLPSFLIQTPLGTPSEETFEYKPPPEIPKKMRRGSKVSIVPPSQPVVEQTKQELKKHKLKGGKSRKRPKKSYQGLGLKGLVNRWVYEEVRLSMSKMSIVSLVLGLLFLGTLFFIIGFLAAVSTVGSKKEEEARRSQPTWQASNAASKGKEEKKLGQVANAVGGSIVGKELHDYVGGPLGKIVASSTKIIPRPLQPFARYGANRTNSEAQRTIRQANPFTPRSGRASSMTQQPYQGGQQPYQGGQQPYQGGQQPYQGMQQPPGAPQQYTSGQNQYYGAPMPMPYPQPITAYQASPPQGASAGGYGQGYTSPPQQQPFMAPQPYYQQAPQQMVPQQTMGQQPQMPMQQQMPPQPQYQQQPVMIQQRYYR